MKVFVWEDLDRVSNNYHSNGGLLVVASTLEEAKALVEKPMPSYKGQPEQYWEQSVKIDQRPDYVFDVVGQVEPMVLVFPNAGCC